MKTIFAALALSALGIGFVSQLVIGKHVVDPNYSAQVTPIHDVASYVAMPGGSQCSVRIVEVKGKQFAVVMSGNSVGICEVRQ